MPRKKIPQSKIVLFYPNKIKLSDLALDVTNEYRGKIELINFFLFFNILSEPYLTFNDEPNKYYQIHSNVIKCIFRDNYKQVIEDLVKYEYIQVNNGHSNVLHICKGYRIHPKRIDLNASFSFIEEEYSQHFERKLQTLRMLNFSKNDNPLYQHVIQQTANLFLVPSVEAIEYVRQEFKRLGKASPPEYYFTYFNNNPIRSPFIDSFGNRLHSIITNMPKVIRKCLRFKSHPDMITTEIDIVNSQPFFLSSVTSELIAKYVPVASEAIPIFEKYQNDINFNKFKNYCRDGGIYEYLQSCYELEYDVICNGNNEAKRDFTKKLTYSALFGDYDLKDSLKIEELKKVSSVKKQQFYLIFKREFPIVYKLFKEVKSLKWEFTVNNKGERKPYANNCLLAQRLESSAMFNQIINACLENGYTEMVTVHDCILCRQDEYDAIKAIAEMAFNEINLNPKFK